MKKLDVEVAILYYLKIMVFFDVFQELKIIFYIKISIGDFYVSYINNIYYFSTLKLHSDTNNSNKLMDFLQVYMI